MKLQHIGFIMDGNRTWAREQGLNQFEGHKNGYANMESIIDGCLKKKIPFVSFWGLSDDNIRERSALELKYLYDLLVDNMERLVMSAQRKSIRLQFIGDRNLLRGDCRDAMKKAEGLTAENTLMTVIFAIGYGGQEEIVRAIQTLAISGYDMKHISREQILEKLETGKFPPPDLIVRTGGHIRHSGYFLFQSPYAEYYFSQKNWPAYDQEELERTIQDFSGRIRKFGR